MWPVQDPHPNVSNRGNLYLQIDEQRMQPAASAQLSDCSDTLLPLAKYMHTYPRSASLRAPSLLALDLLRQQTPHSRGRHETRRGRKVILCPDEIVEVPVGIYDGALYCLAVTALPLSSLPTCSSFVTIRLVRITFRNCPCR